ncbi:MAG: dihydrofolate reductase family protein [Candidatus Altiarchaeota archaeon]
MPQPYVILDLCMSVNGKHVEGGQHKNRLNEYRKQELRGRVDAIIVSSGDIVRNNPEFPVNTSIKKEPEIVIIDKHCETPPKSAVLKDERKRIKVIVSKSASPSRIKDLRGVREDLEVLVIGEHTVNLDKTLWELHNNGLHRILVEGDPALNTRMLRERLVNEVYVMVYPMILEGKENAFEDNVEGDKQMQLEGILQYGDHTVMHYVIR